MPLFVFMRTNIYLESGYLNQKVIRRLADKNNINFIVEIGKRQVGKTYGVLQMMLENETPFILMRRTITEMEFICNDINNPFTAIPNSNVHIKKDSKYSASMHRDTPESDAKYIGEVMSLSTIAKIRGFNGQIYTDVVYDECIPENHVMKIRNEEDAFLNAYVTISGAREENGEKPLRMWLLANSNNIDTPILRALNITEQVEKMENKQQELCILPNRGIMIVRPFSEFITEKRKKTSIFKAVGTDSNFAQMALANKFSYNDFSDIAHFNLKAFTPIFAYDGITCYRHKSQDRLHFVGFEDRTLPDKRIYGASDRGRKKLMRDFPTLRDYYVQNRITFDDMTIKQAIFTMLTNHTI